jgi:hypothetical protein
MKNIFKVLCIFVILILSFKDINARALQSNIARHMQITLIPDYVDKTIRFDGTVESSDQMEKLDLTGLPVNIEYQWKDSFPKYLSYDIRASDSPA